jgi:hypothetical protein
MVNLVSEKKTATMGIESKVSTGISLSYAQVLNFLDGECPASVLFPGAATFDSDAPPIGVSLAPTSRLLIDRLTVSGTKFTFIGSMTDFTKASLAITFWGAVEKFREWLDLVASPTMLFARILEFFFGLSILFGVRVPRFLAANLTLGMKTVFVSNVLVELRQRLEGIATLTKFHLASVRKSVFHVWGRQARNTCFSVRQPSPLSIIQNGRILSSWRSV